MKAHHLRQTFIDFFVSHGHVAIPSASLVPENDPSVLFTTAGMHPLVPYLLGEEHPSGRRLVSAQKCVRTGDIDEVGDATHLTFFEMLGNWSLGDYFKDESIRWSFEFLTSPSWLNIPLDRLAVSVFAGDDDVPRDEESAALWLSLGVAPERIAYLGKADNWWPAGGKHPGPQGPDTEIFYYVGSGPVPAVFDPHDARWVEIWNNVFMQFDKRDGALTALSQKNVDTGMGLERTAAVLQGVSSVYETDLFVPIINQIRSVASERIDISERVIADHVRAAVFILADRAGIVPSNTDQGYILRRLLRRAVRHGRTLGIDNMFMQEIADVVVREYASAYPEVAERRAHIREQIRLEEERFFAALRTGMREFEKIWDRDGDVSGTRAFDLYQSYGFPLELTIELVREKGRDIDVDVFRSEFAKHQELSRAGAGKKFAGGLADDSPKTIHGHTATHLLHQALRTVLGEHVEQRGSNITSERLRFDFSHPDKLTDEQKSAVERMVNEYIARDLPVSYTMMSVDDAKRAGAIGLFDDHYARVGDMVKVYSVGDETNGFVSREICGGPHVSSTGEIGSFRILKEESVASGIRRIKASVE